MMVAFILLGHTIIAAGNILIGILSLALLFTLTAAAGLVGISISEKWGNGYDPVPAIGPDDDAPVPAHNVPRQIIDSQAICLWVLYGVELVLFSSW
jgi:hypothetical protein